MFHTRPFTSAALAASPSRLTPTSRTWAAFGDSRVANGACNIANTVQNWLATPTETSTRTGQRNMGWQFWAQFYSKGRIQFPGSLNFGVSGDTVVNMAGASRIDIAVTQTAAAGAAGIVFQGGTNDFTGGASAASVKAAWSTIFAKCRAAGLRIMVVTDTPRGTATYSSQRLSAANLASLLAVRGWLLAQQAYDLTVIDGWDGLADPTSTLGDWASNNLTTDGTHFTPQAAQILGKRIAAVANALYPPLANLPASNADLYNAATNPTGSILANPMMSGSGGTVNTNGSGTLAASWVASINNARAGYTAVYSQPTTIDADGVSKTWQQVVLSGTPTGANQLDAISQGISLGTYPVGTRMRFVGEIEWDAGMTGVLGLMGGIDGARTNMGGFWFAANGMDGGGTVGIDGTKAGSGYIVTDPYVLAADITSVAARFKLTLLQNVAVSATVRFRAGGVLVG